MARPEFEPSDPSPTRERFGPLEDPLSGALAALMILLVVVGTGNVCLRFLGRFLGQSLASNAWIELQWCLFAVTFAFGGVAAVRMNRHVRVDVWYGRRSERLRERIDRVATLALAVPMLLVLLYTSSQVAWSSLRILEHSSDPGGLPRYPLRVAWVIALLGFITVLLRPFAGARTPKRRPR